MKTISKFVCEYCGSIYDTEEKCIDCEAKHKVDPVIVKLDYGDIQLNKTGHPRGIVVRFGNDNDKIFATYTLATVFSSSNLWNMSEHNGENLDKNETIEVEE